MPKQKNNDGCPIDKIKHKKEMEKALNKLVVDGTRILKFIQMHPDIWAKDELSPFRDLAYKITGDPSKYQPPVVQEGWGMGVDELTTDIGNRL